MAQVKMGLSYLSGSPRTTRVHQWPSGNPGPLWLGNHHLDFKNKPKLLPLKSPFFSIKTNRYINFLSFGKLTLKEQHYMYSTRAATAIEAVVIWEADTEGATSVFEAVTAV